MGQKVNPISLRLQKTNRHFDSCWYDDYNYTHLLLQDYKIKNYLKTVLHQIKYPESRIINIGIPKKNIYNLFYFNPSNSRRKKNVKFQLQNFKEKVTKNKKGFYKNKDSEKDVHSFFSFSERQLLRNDTFTLAQQQIEEKGGKINLANEDRKKVTKQKHFKDLKDHTVYFSLSNPKENLFLFNKKMYPVQIPLSLYDKPATSLTSQKDVSDIKVFNRRSVGDDTFQTSQTSQTSRRLQIEDLSVRDVRDVRNVRDLMASSQIENLSVKDVRDVRSHIITPNTLNSINSNKDNVSTEMKYSLNVKVPTVYSDRKKSFFNLNQLLLEFVIKNNNGVQIFDLSESISHRSQNNTNVSNIPNIPKGCQVTNLQFNSKQSQDLLSTINVNSKFIKNLDSERFFVRYLLAQLYCNYLQNKEYITAESYTTLYRFYIFFKEKKIEKGPLLKRYRNLKENNQVLPFLDYNHNQKLRHFEKGNVSSAQNQRIDADYTDKSSICNQTSHTFQRSRRLQIEDLSVKDVRLQIFDYMRQIEDLSVRDVSVEPKGRVRGFRIVSDHDKKKHHFQTPQTSLYNCLGANLVYKSHLEFSLSKEYFSFYSVNLYRTLIEKQSASFLVQEIIYYLERKIPFRRIKTIIYKEIPHYKNIKGIRIKCSGRVGGRSKKAQRSKTQSVKRGQTSLGVFSSKIDFACKSAYTRFGLIGVKVWVCYQ
ncbi:MAG: hypothetical protein EOO34_00380 [Cyanobacteriota bacterium]|nr:MAG: hypothetical protein EOO34_00380 [Cyanobacteriota bacterium]